MSKPALSKHLAILSSAGLIESEKKGQFVHYNLVRENLFASMHDFLVDFCPKGKPLKIESESIAKSQRDAED
jgi:DNA-binding transcriptional ArsR family regulator